MNKIGAVHIAGLKLANPIMPASGTWSLPMMRILLKRHPDFRPGAIVLKGVTLEPRAGNEPPRVIETPAGMINFIGLQNGGLKHFRSKVLPAWREFGVPLIVNISGKLPHEYGQIVEELEDEDVAGYEGNVSCPNMEGIIYGTRANLTRGIVRLMRQKTRRLILVKLTPNVTDIGEMANVAEEAGADAISAVNTFLARAYDADFDRYIRGGQSGRAIKAMALAKVEEVCRVVKIPVVGMGGISSAKDAREFLSVHERVKAIAVGTANFTDPTIMAQIWQGLQSGQ